MNTNNMFLSLIAIFLINRSNNSRVLEDEPKNGKKVGGTTGKTAE